MTKANIKTAKITMSKGHKNQNCNNIVYKITYMISYFQKKGKIKHRNTKVLSKKKTRERKKKKEQSIETVLDNLQLSDLIEKDFKKTTINMSK